MPLKIFVLLGNLIHKIKVFEVEAMVLGFNGIFEFYPVHSLARGIGRNAPAACPSRGMDNSLPQGGREEKTHDIQGTIGFGEICCRC